MKNRVCPDYRLRLFQSVDLVGSTAFKARYSSTESGSSDPIWVVQIKHFYAEFPRIFRNVFEQLNVPISGGHPDDPPPAVWKTIGDEIVFCCRLCSLEHLSVCIKAFMRALDEYGSHLDGKEQHLDVKGACWVAPFPTPNIAVDIAIVKAGGEGAEPVSEVPDETDEVRADTKPADFDFLGQHIDAGFRTTKMSSSDNMSSSLELAYLLTQAAKVKLLDGVKFHYHGRQALKGVLRDRPYPMVTIDMERSESRRSVLDAERNIFGSRAAEPVHICAFLEAFMCDEQIELPILPRRKGGATAILPDSYLSYRSGWESVREEMEQRSASETEADNFNTDEQTEIPDEITKSLAEVVSNKSLTWMLPADENGNKKNAPPRRRRRKKR